MPPRVASGEPIADVHRAAVGFLVTEVADRLDSLAAATDTPRMTRSIETIASPIRPASKLAGERPLAVEADDGFIQTGEVIDATERAMTYLSAGYPVHLSGPAGTGKTTLAFHIAARRGRPVALVHGSDAFSGSDLVGRDNGYRKSTVVDNFIHSVVKTEEKVDMQWTDNRVTRACELGHTLIYDEFNRTRAEANNILLSILEEGILSVPQRSGGYIRVHPEFRLILTSNPDEYAGVHRTQDALADRLITIRRGHYDAESERQIVMSATGADEAVAAACVDLVRSLRGELGEHPRPTIRAAIGLARVTGEAGAPIDPEDPRFAGMAWDILGADAESVLAESSLSEAGFRAHVARVLGRPSAASSADASPPAEPAQPASARRIRRVA